VSEAKQYTVRLDKAVQKTLNRLPRRPVERLVLAMRGLADNPRPHGCKKLSGTANDYRIRVGDYRIIYTIFDDVLVVFVINVGHRKDVYRP
jgi:mRNA interferase RelE/StbE